MTTNYVSTLAHYVLVDAANEADALELGCAALIELTGNTAPNIWTIRPATDDEIEFWRWQHEVNAREETLKS